MEKVFNGGTLDEADQVPRRASRIVGDDHHLHERLNSARSDTIDRIYKFYERGVLLDDPDSVDYRTDIYGLGCVLYEMLVGAPAFRSAKMTELISRKRRPLGPNPCDENPAVPLEVGRFVTTMLAADRVGIAIPPQPAEGHDVYQQCPG